MVKPAAKRVIANYISKSYAFSERRACRLLSISLSTKRYIFKEKDPKDEEAKAKLIELARANLRYGYRRLKICLANCGYPMNHKKVYRLYKEANLVLSRKKSKKLKKQPRAEKPKPAYFNDCWSIDFINDKLTDSRKFRCLNIVDDYSRGLT